MIIYIRTQWNCLLGISVFGADLVTITAVLQPRRGVPLSASTQRSVSSSRPNEILIGPRNPENCALPLRLSSAEIPIRESACQDKSRSHSCSENYWDHLAILALRNQ